MTSQITRRNFALGAAAGIAAATTLPRVAAAKDKPFSLRYVLSSAMYGYASLKEIVPQIKQTGATAIDIWPKVHGNQREQVTEMGAEAFAEMLKKHDVQLGVVTNYQQGPFNLAKDMELVSQVAASDVTLVCGAKGPRNLKGSDLKAAVAKFVEQLKPHAERAQKHGCTIAIENHANSLIESPDSIRWFGELVKSPNLGVAFAPHHLPQDGKLIGAIAADLGDRLKFFYAQQHGAGSSKKLPKEQELLQMPGRGELDFGPTIAALKENKYQGYTEIFMHPVPRGVPILESPKAITAEINRARKYLESLL